MTRVADILKSKNLPTLEVEILLAEALQSERTQIRAYPDRELTAEEELNFKELLERRYEGEPIAYILGHKEFWSMDFIITPSVLIPRPDSELLVELVLEELTENSKDYILELGTGSGAIALAIASERKKLQIIATDESKDALEIAKENAKKFKIKNVSFVQGDWFEAFKSEHKFNLILSNPPYVAYNDPHLMTGDLRYEPHNALVAGRDGMSDIHKIVSSAANYLTPNGWLYIEHGYDQEHLVQDEFVMHGYKEIQCHRDLSGVPRVTVGQKP